MLYRAVHYGVTADGYLDYDMLRDVARRERPKMIIAGASAYPRVIDFPAFAEVAQEVGAIFMVDMAHIAGLVATGHHPSPIPYADVGIFPMRISRTTVMEASLIASRGRSTLNY